MPEWMNIDEVRIEALTCCRCDLCHGRTQVVFGEGPVPAPLMIVGEGPGGDEDRIGRPFVGRAGHVLDSVLGGAGIARESCWVTNIVRCRPTELREGVVRNRAPRADEIRACDLWMTQEYRFVQPRAVVCLGTVPAKALIGRGFAIGTGRGRWHEGKGGIPTTATYHPAYLLRLRGDDRRRVEQQMLEDFQMAAREVGG
ncbi:MAG: uracil-DNA glycosylase [Armatimonadota bacterium]